MDRWHYPVKRCRLQDPEDHAYTRGLTPIERMLRVWPLTLIENKRAAGRPKDLADLHELENEERDE